MTKHMILTEATVDPIVGANETYPPRWIRLPTRGRCPYTGLSRAAYYELIQANRIRTANLKKPGALRGMRLVWLPSIMAYLDRFATGGTEN